MEQIKLHNHPEYSKNIEAWETYTDLYTGDRAALLNPRYLWMHEFERNAQKGGDILRKTREQRTRYINYLKAFIRRYVAMLFKGGLKTDDVLKLFKDDIRNIDGNGASLESFCKQVAEHYFIYGKVGIFTDSFAVQARNRLEQEKIGQRPFWEIVTARELKDWQKADGRSSRRGLYNSIRTEYPILEPRQSLLSAPETRMYSRILTADGSGYAVETYQGGKVTKGGVIEGDGAWKLVDQAEIAKLTEIPITIITDDSWLKDLAPVSLLLYNEESTLSNILLYQAHQRIIASGPFKEGDGIVMNEASVALMPEGFDITVVTPADPVALRNHIETLKAALFQIAFSRTRVLPTDSRLIESADNQREAKEEFIATLQDAGERLQDTFNQAVRNYALFKGISDYEEGVKLDLELTIEDLDQQLQIAQAWYNDIRNYTSWYKANLKKVAAQQSLDTEEILSEIEAAEPTVRRTQFFTGVNEQ